MSNLSSLLYSAIRLKVQTTTADGSSGGISTATGFFVSSYEQLALITNRHVVDPTWSSSGYDTKHYGKKVAITYSGRPHTDQQLEFTLPSDEFVFSEKYSDDVALILVKLARRTDSLPLFVNRFIRHFDISQKEEFGQSVEIGDEVAFVGYNEWNSESYDRPILRTGRIVSDPKFPVSFTQVQGDAFLIEGFTTRGMSGSPVFALERGLRFESVSPLTINDPRYRPFRLIGASAGYLGSNE